MADNIDITVDASQIVAKLHLAAVMSLKFAKDEFIVNTGIEDDVLPSAANPAKVGKTRFQLDNPSHVYQVGFATFLEYHKTYDLENALNDISEFLAKTSGDKSKIADKIKSNKEEYKKFEEQKTEIKDIFAALGEKVANNQLNSIEQIKALKEKAKKLITNDAEEYRNTLEEKKFEAVEKLNAYMKVFAGPNGYKNISVTDIGMVNIASTAKDSTAKGLVDGFEIQSISNQEKQKMATQFRLDFKKDPKNKNCRQKVCFYVEYTLNVDK